MDLGLRGKVAIVTGSSRGIGYAVARALAEEGARVVMGSRNPEALERARREIAAATGSEVVAVRTDLSVRDDVERIVGEAVKVFGDLDILVFNPGPPKVGTIMELSDEDWDYGVRLLLMSAVRLTREAARIMMKRRWGRLIYITSWTLKQASANIALSNIVRIATAGLVKTAAIEFGPHGITANGIMQGHIETERLRAVIGDVARRRGISFEEQLGEMLREIPVGRLGRPEEIGYLAAFLASERASYINGAMILIDGGFVRATL